LATRACEQLLHRAELVEQHGLGRRRRRAVLRELREEPAGLRVRVGGRVRVRVRVRVSLREEPAGLGFR